ncbi:hypothetical protein GPECTOR_9g738 [Gonium pectorale]|uniref:Uncharacterized protein n=1 Tax=Gonium pectorale TaxID=33097 RepID=A0A150GSJ8_GONPE|nr:hypothetical protein GPECTOR_9g738 [Gonium pectorale]|eukprot:KXZ52692.1 hypothetical protein GPECTOR_9g738 [Gonium pectorale]
MTLAASEQHGGGEPATESKPTVKLIPRGNSVSCSGPAGGEAGGPGEGGAPAVARGKGQCEGDDGGRAGDGGGGGEASCGSGCCAPDVADGAVAVSARPANGLPSQQQLRRLSADADDAGAQSGGGGGGADRSRGGKGSDVDPTSTGAAAAAGHRPHPTQAAAPQWPLPNGVAWPQPHAKAPPAYDSLLQATHSHPRGAAPAASSAGGAAPHMPHLPPHPLLPPHHHGVGSGGHTPSLPNGKVRNGEVPPAAADAAAAGLLAAQQLLMPLLGYAQPPPQPGVSGPTGQSGAAVSALSPPGRVAPNGLEAVLWQQLLHAKQGGGSAGGVVALPSSQQQSQAAAQVSAQAQVAAQAQAQASAVLGWQHPHPQLAAQYVAAQQPQLQAAQAQAVQQQQLMQAVQQQLYQQQVLQAHAQAQAQAQSAQQLHPQALQGVALAHGTGPGAGPGPGPAHPEPVHGSAAPAGPAAAAADPTAAAAAATAPPQGPSAASHGGSELGGGPAATEPQVLQPGPAAPAPPLAAPMHPQQEQPTAPQQQPPPPQHQQPAVPVASSSGSDGVATQASWEAGGAAAARGELGTAPPQLVERPMGHQHRVQSQGNMLAAAQGGGGGRDGGGGGRSSSSYRGRSSFTGMGGGPGGGGAQAVGALPGGGAGGGSGAYGGRQYGAGGGQRHNSGAHGYVRGGGGGGGAGGGRYDAGGSADSSRPSSRGPHPYGGGGGGGGQYRHPGPHSADPVPPPEALPLPEPKGSCDLDRFISQIEPFIAIDPDKPPQQALQELRLRDLWNFYFEPSLYGREVFTLGGHRGASNSYFVPYLSAIQIFMAAMPTDVVGLNWYNMQGERWMEPLDESAVAAAAAALQQHGLALPSPAASTPGAMGGSARAPAHRGGGRAGTDVWYQQLLHNYQVNADRLARGIGLKVLGQHGAEEVRLRVPDYEFFRARGP